MIGRNKYRNIGSFKDFSERGKDTDTYKPLLNGYTKKVKEEIVLQLKERKKLSQTDAEDFLVNLFSLGDKRLNEIKDIISDSFSKDKNAKLCAENLISKYYGITRINKYDDPYTHEEVTEIQESLLNKLEGPSEEEMNNYLETISDKYLALEIAIENGYLNGVKKYIYMIKGKSDMEKDRLLDIAVDSGNIDIVNILIDKGADINHTYSTPIYYAAENGDYDMVEFILKYYLENEYDISDIELIDPINVADSNGLEDIVKLIE